MIAARSGNVHAKHNVVHGKAISNIERLKVMSIKFIKDKETKTKVRYAAAVSAAQQGVSGSLYVDKDSELAKDSEIILEISQVTA